MEQAIVFRLSNNLPLIKFGIITVNFFHNFICNTSASKNINFSMQNTCCMEKPPHIHRTDISPCILERIIFFYFKGITTNGINETITSHRCQTISRGIHRNSPMSTEQFAIVHSNHPIFPLMIRSHYSILQSQIMLRLNQLIRD